MTIDTTPPQLISISFPAVIDLGDGNVAATFSVTATDNVEMGQAMIWFDSSVGYGLTETFPPGSWPFVGMSGEWTDDQASVTRYFAQDHRANAARTVSLDRVVIEDVNGNSKTYRQADLEAMGLPTSFDLIAAVPDTTPPQLISISFPAVIDLGDGNVAATFSVTATDNVEMGQALIWFDSSVGYGLTETFPAGSWPFVGMSGEWTDDQASVTRYFAQDHSANAARTVSLDRVVIEDVNGNSRTYRQADLEAMGLQTSFALWQGGAPVADLGFSSVRSGNMLIVRISNEGDARDGASLSGQIAFSLDGASFVSAAALGTSTFNSSMSQVGGNIQLNFNASLAGTKATGAPLIEFKFDLTQTGSISIFTNSMMLDGRSANVTPPEQVNFEIAMAQVHGVVQNRAGDALEGATVTFARENALAKDAFTSGTGSFGFEVMQGLSGQLHASRDYNPATDGIITARDALDVLRLAVGLAPSFGNASPLDFIAADINQDGQVTAADALDVLRAAVGLQSTYQPRWIFFDSAADFGEVDRGNTHAPSGIMINPLMAELPAISMTGVLLGSMQEYA